MTVSPEAMRQAMRIIWEGEGNKWDDLYEYPYNDFERASILKRLSDTVEKLNNHFPSGMN